MRWIETAHVSFLLLAAVLLESATEDRMPSHSGTLLAVISPRPLWPTPSISIPSTPAKRERVRAAEGADGPQPYIHRCSIENNPGSDYPSGSCVPHL